MNQYTKEFQQLKPYDPVQFTSTLKNGYEFITTAGHGYLVVPMNDDNIEVAKSFCEYGYIGDRAVYLEEDCEAPRFEKFLQL